MRQQCNCQAATASASSQSSPAGKLTVAERRANDTIGLAVAISSLKLGPGKPVKGAGRGKAKGGKGKSKGKKGKKNDVEQESPGPQNEDGGESLGSAAEDASVDQLVEKNAEAEKKAKTILAKAKAKSSKRKATKKEEGDGKKKRPFPNSHLLNEWKRFLATKREEYAGKMSYHKIMSLAAEEYLSCRILLCHFTRHINSPHD